MGKWFGGAQAEAYPVHELDPTDTNREVFLKTLLEVYEGSDVGKQVQDPLSPDFDLTNARMFVVGEGDAVFALKGDDIVYAGKVPGSKAKNVAYSMLQLAVDEGGRRLDAFDGFLPRIYSDMGFRAVARLPFDPEYAPRDWNVETQGTPDIVGMIFDPSYNRRYADGDGEYVNDYDDIGVAQKTALNEYKGVSGTPETSVEGDVGSTPTTSTIRVKSSNDNPVAVKKFEERRLSDRVFRKETTTGLAKAPPDWVVDLVESEYTGSQGIDVVYSSGRANARSTAGAESKDIWGNRHKLLTLKSHHFEKQTPLDVFIVLHEIAHLNTGAGHVPRWQAEAIRLYEKHGVLDEASYEFEKKAIDKYRASKAPTTSTTNYTITNTGALHGRGSEYIVGVEGDEPGILVAKR